MLTDSYIAHLTGGSDAATTKTPSEKGLWVSQWETIHAGAVLMAGRAITKKAWPHLRQAEGVMSDAKAGFDPLIVAIMGVRAPDLSNRLLAALHTAGQHATADQIKAAQALIKSNAEQMETRRQKPVKAAPALKPAVKPHHQAIVAWLADNGPAKPDVVIDATGSSNITIRAMVKDGIIWENRKGEVGI